MAHANQGAPAQLNDPLLAIFTGLYQLTNMPQHLPYLDLGYDPDFCHLSAKHCAMMNGGRRVHGWAIWKFPELIVGESHSVWEQRDSKLVDVTPPKFGASHILFIRDDKADIVPMEGGFVMWADRTTDLQVPFLFNGNPLPEPNWGLPVDNVSMVAYCVKHGMSPSDIVTDAKFG